MVFEPLGPVEFTSMLSRSSLEAVAEVLPKSQGTLRFHVVASAGCPWLWEGGALPGDSVGVNLKQQADIPVGSVTGHAWLMMPGRQVTLVHHRGEKLGAKLLVTCPQSSEGWGSGQAWLSDVTSPDVLIRLRPLRWGIQR